MSITFYERQDQDPHKFRTKLNKSHFLSEHSLSLFLSFVISLQLIETLSPQKRICSSTFKNFICILIHSTAHLFYNAYYSWSDWNTFTFSLFLSHSLSRMTKEYMGKRPRGVTIHDFLVIQWLVRILGFPCRRYWSIPGLGTKILWATQQLSGRGSGERVTIH